MMHENDFMTKIRVASGFFCLAMAVYAYAIASGADGALLGSFYSPPALFIIAAGPVSFCIMTWKQRQASLFHWYRLMGRSILVMGSVGVLAGVMKVMKALDRPEEIGMGIVVAVVSMVLSMILGFGVMAYAYRLREDEEDGAIAEALFFPVVVPLIALMLVFVVLFAFKKEC